MFNLKSSFKPTGDQPQAIEKLVKGLKNNYKNQVLLGVTGSGKTFTMANIIKKLNIPTLIISHNKTLAGQLYQEMREFFPENGVSYFVSYYDYYQPEAYMPQTDTYIEKEAEINELIDKLRLQSTTNILTRNDVVVVASVSCIYNIGSPKEYGSYVLEIKRGEKTDWNKIAYQLAKLHYERSEFDFNRGTFRIRGNEMDIYPAYEDWAYRVTLTGQKVSKFIQIEPLTGKQTKLVNNKKIIIYPAKHFMTNEGLFKTAEPTIRHDLKIEYESLKKRGKPLEAERLLKRVNYDLELIKEVGYVNGIENYSRYFDGRNPGDPPYSLINYFKEAYGNNFLVFIDESHMTVPQIRGMYNGDYSRKRILVDFGFRLRAAFDNRPMTFDEFYKSVPKLIYVSATPDEWEIERSKIPSTPSALLRINSLKTSKNQKSKVVHTNIVEQLVRPTGIIDPQIFIRPSKNEVLDLIPEIEKRVAIKEKILVTTLTKRIAEDLTAYLKEKKIRAEYLHSDIQTLERSDVLDNLRKGKFDVLIGINLLREGLDLPEVSLVAILDADKEGFLRSKTALIQTMGRASRNVSGQVIIYADKITKSIKAAVAEIDRRRKYQIKYNMKYNIEPKTIYKPLRERIIQAEDVNIGETILVKDKVTREYLDNIKPAGLTPYDKKRLISKLEREMRQQAQDLNFELAIEIRNKIKKIRD